MTPKTEDLETMACGYDDAGCPETAAALRELRDLRAAQAASRERVFAVVRKAFMDHPGSHAGWDHIAVAIANRAADALAATQSTLTEQQVREAVLRIATEVCTRWLDNSDASKHAGTIATRAAKELAGAVAMGAPTAPPELGLSGFVAEMHEMLREARQTCAVDRRGRNVELYFGDMMRRLEEAVDVVNDRITSRGGRTLAEMAAHRAVIDQAQRETDLRGAFLAGTEWLSKRTELGDGGAGFHVIEPSQGKTEDAAAEYARCKVGENAERERDAAQAEVERLHKVTREADPNTTDQPSHRRQLGDLRSAIGAILSNDDLTSGELRKRLRAAIGSAP